VRVVSHAPRGCSDCGTVFTPRRADAVFCSPTCRVRGHRRNGRREGVEANG
jgi:hypothetical protein